MRILHCCLSCFYIDEYNYQENMLPVANKKHGCEVEIIASTETYNANGKLCYINAGKYKTTEGITINRVLYAKCLPHFVMKKIRAYKGVYNLIDAFKPDIIMFHGMPAYELHTVVKYVKQHPNVTLYVDSHEDYNNSGRNFISRYFLHRLFYRNIIRKSIPHISKVFYITEETKDFITKEYQVPEDKLEYYPLGGDIVRNEEKEKYKLDVRLQLGVNEDTVLLFHSGKLDRLKKTTDIIQAINKIDSNNVLLLVAGNIPPDYAELEQEINECSKVKWLGWLNVDEVRKYLCACDIYVQPGSQSVTAQNAMCCGAPVMLYPHKSYVKLCRNNVFWVKNTEDISSALQKVLNQPEMLSELSEASFALAYEMLDYDALAKKIEQRI